MFNPHHQQQHHHQQQQQQQQFHHHLRQLQQLFQHQPPPPPPPPPPPQPPPSHHVPHHHHHHHHQGGRAMTVTAPAPPPPRMVNLAAQATIMAPNPMLQGALLMQQMQGSMRGFAAMSGQQFTQFFAAGARSSLLGPVPMGVAIKTPHMGFPARHYHPHARYYNNDYASRQPDRKRANEQRASGSTDGQPAASGTAEDSSDKALKDGRVGGPDGQAQPSVQAEPEEPVLKKQRTEGLEGTAEQPAETDSVLTTAQYKRPTESQPGVCVILHEGGSMAGPEAAEALEESRAAQVQSEMSAMPASEPLSAESQAFTPCLDMAEGTAAQETSEGGQEEATAAPGLLAEGQEEGGDAANKFYCYICNITCHNQQIFQSHMNGLAHQQRMMEIQHMSNACLVTLLPRVQESLQGGRRDASSFRDGEKRPGLQRWCATCQIHFTCPVMEHRKTREHKLFSRASSPSCTVCKRDFRSPRLFLEHMQSQEHKLRVDKLREEGGPDSLAELVAMDTHGCCVADGEEEEEEEEEGDEDEDDREDGGEGSAHGKEPWPTQMEVALLEDVAEDEEYDPDTVYGSSFVVPMAGFLCRLCQRFYHFESAARQSHCKSLQHFENLKKYRALRSQKESQVEPTPANMDGEAECDSNHTVSDSKRLSPELLTSPSLLRPTMSTPIPRPSRCCTEPQENAPSASCLSQQDPTTTSSSPTTSSPEGTAAEASPEQQSPVGPEDKEETPNPDLAPEDESGLVTAEMEEAEAAAPEEKTGKGKAKGSSKRRYGRTTRRR
ncbi:cdkn1a interacting zinc finger protein 1a [Esox lucius]|uniref:Matrin-type domain-containing protein n=1 Tax=Esox lucius TaxID=8010 RepID=A0A3P9A351_ESOLU|nr:cdkn1a interacting zinc finger protein 1a [Esox lucius]